MAQSAASSAGSSGRSSQHRCCSRPRMPVRDGTVRRRVRRSEWTWRGAICSYSVAGAAVRVVMCGRCCAASRLAVVV